MITRVCSDLESCRAAINNIIDESKLQNPFLSYDWLRIWCRHFISAPKSLHILLFIEGDKKVGFAPFYKIRRRFFGLYEYHIVGASHASYLDVPCLHGYENKVLSSLIEHFHSLPHGAIVYLCDINDRFSRSFNVLKETFWCCNNSAILTLYTCPLAALPRDWDQYYIRQRNKKSRKNLKRSETLMSQLGSFQVRDVTNVAEFRNINKELQRIHAERFSHTLNSLFCGNNADFFSDVLELLGTKDVCLSVAELDGVKVSFFLGFRMGNVFIDYAPAFDPAFEKLSIGTLHLANLIKTTLYNGFDFFDFSKGDASYKRWWANDETRNYLLVRGFNLGFRGKIFYRLQLLKFKIALWLRIKGFSGKIKRALRMGIRLLRQYFGIVSKFIEPAAPVSIKVEEVPRSYMSQKNFSKLQPWSYSLIWMLPLLVRKTVIELILKQSDGWIKISADDKAKEVLIVMERSDVLYRVCYRL